MTRSRRVLQRPFAGYRRRAAKPSVAVDWRWCAWVPGAGLELHWSPPPPRGRSRTAQDVVIVNVSTRGAQVIAPTAKDVAPETLVPIGAGDGTGSAIVRWTSPPRYGSTVYGLEFEKLDGELAARITRHARRRVTSSAQFRRYHPPRPGPIVVDPTMQHLLLTLPMATEPERRSWSPCAHPVRAVLRFVLVTAVLCAVLAWLNLTVHNWPEIEAEIRDFWRTLTQV